MMAAMLSRIDFLSLVLPPTGQYCVVGLNKDKKPKQIFVESIQEVSDYADAMVHKGYDAYFALASFQSPTEGRTVANADQLNCLFVDIDCGPNKAYADQSEGMESLIDFLASTNLPKPTAVVNSGRGLHAYWVFEQPLGKQEWKPIAERFKALCQEHKFEADPAVTADVARILRIPDTLNFKDPTNPLSTKVLVAGKRVNLESFTSKLPAPDLFEIPGQRPNVRQMDPMTLALMGNYQSKFKTILIKSLNGEGCEQLANAFRNQGVLEEPLWRAALSIAQHCVDGPVAIHKLSIGHPGYSEANTIRKAGETKGPYTCDTFRKLNPTGCQDCTLKISSPIQIGREIVEASEEDNTVTHVEEVTKEPTTYVIPTYPFPFFRGKVGGVYRRADPNKEDDKDELIYPYDFYVVKRIHDPEDGETLLMRLHLPKDGVREFIMPLSAALSKEKFVGTIALQGMAVLGKKQDILMGYVTRWVEELQAMNKSEIARKQFGWLEDNSAFIVGDREIQSDGKVGYSPPTSTTLPIIPAMKPKGDFHVWKDVINAYAREEMANRAFAFFMGFGGPLMKFVGGGMLDGFLLNLVSQKSGSGKTTLLHAVNSIYGNPKALMLSYKDTHNHRLQRLGTMQSMTPTIDELTNLEPKAMGALVYDITSGKGKNRMSSKANVERINNTTWQIPVVSSSNRKVKDALLTIKSFPEAELMRILEDEILPDPNDDPTWSKAHFGRLGSNYGHAIEPFIQYVSANLPTVVALLDKINEKLDTAAGIKNTERFWSAGIAIAITGGIIAKKLKLHDIPIEPVFDHAVNLVKNTRNRNTEELGGSGEDFLGGFLQRHYQDILVINGNLDKRTGLEHGPIREPRGKVIVRYEPDTKMLFVVNKEWRDDCGKTFMGYEDTLNPYRKNKSYVGLKKKRMLAGTAMGASDGVMALVFDTSKLDFFAEDALVNADSKSDGEDTLGVD
jgi:hypothetical protein